jgi:hypothetical protein
MGSFSFILLLVIAKLHLVSIPNVTTVGIPVIDVIIWIGQVVSATVVTLVFTVIKVAIDLLEPQCVVL